MSNVIGGATNVTRYFAMRLTATGVAATGLTATDFDLQYTRNGAAAVAKVDATLNANGVGGAHSDSTVIEIDATSSPGLYRVDWVDAAFVAGVDDVTLTVKVATAFTEHLRVEIDSPVDMTSISGDTTAADNLELQYDTTGLTGETFPASQQQLSGIANVGSAVHKAPATYTLTTGTQSSGTIASVAALDGVSHEHTDTAGVLLLEYHHLIGSGTPSSVQITGYVSGNNDTVLVAGYDWVAAAYVQIGSIAGQNGTPNPFPVHSFDLFVDMVGSGANEGKVDIKLYATSGLSTSTTRVDQIFVAFSQGVEGYDNGAVWLDTNHTNGNTEVGVDGVARNPASTIADANTLLASTNLHRVEVAPGSSLTFAAGQTDEIFRGHDWTLALGGQDVTGTYILGAIISGTATATGRYVIEDSELNAVTLDDACLVDHCSLADTFTLGQAGTFTLHDCYNESASEITIDFGALGASTVHLFGFEGEVNFTNMAAGDTVHITGKGTITTTTCTAGTIKHDGFFEYTDAGGNVTEQQSDIKVAVDDIQTQVGTAGAGLTDLGGMSTAMKAEVNVEAKDVLFTDTHAELTAVPAANAALADKINWITMIFRNKGTETATTKLVLADDGTTTVGTSTVSDDSVTFTRGEFS